MDIQFVRCNGVDWPNNIDSNNGYQIKFQPMVNDAERAINTARLIMDYKGIILHQIFISYEKLTEGEYKGIYNSLKQFTNLNVTYWDYNDEVYRNGLYYAPFIIEAEPYGLSFDPCYNNCKIELIPIEGVDIL